MIGVSSGLDFETVGASTPVGIWRWICAIFACTSWTARSMSRSISNETVTRAEFCFALDVISTTPVTCASTSSIGLMSPVSMSSGDAPGHDIETDTDGLLTSGNCDTPIEVAPGTMPSAINPNMIVANISIHAKTGRRRHRSVMFTERRPSCGDGRCRCRRRCHRRYPRARASPSPSPRPSPRTARRTIAATRAAVA